MTKRNFAADRAVCDAATPGPFAYIRQYNGIHSVKGPQGVTIASCGANSIYSSGGSYRIESSEAEANAVFIAEARTGWPAALDEIARLRAALEWYANAENYPVTVGAYRTYASSMERDEGQRAREALR
ncbi:hypothetical protein BN871_AT_00210 [Paenibacillus sp. P22]|nr:hypothetical protein BN871_AT_00210 [Paenibacillus sp. P22]